jgi:hypothetical protein
MMMGGHAAVEKPELRRAAGGALGRASAGGNARGERRPKAGVAAVPLLSARGGRASSNSSSAGLLWLGDVGVFR